MPYDVSSALIVPADIGKNIPYLSEIWRLIAEKDFRCFRVAEDGAQGLVQFMCD